MELCIIASGDFFSDYGGGQVYVRNIVDEFAHHSELSTSVISFNANQQPSIKDYKGIPVHVVNDETNLLNTLKSIQPDIVHANGEKLITSRMCKQLNIPCIVTAHHGGIVCPAGALLNTNDEICNIPADFSHCLKCYLRNIPTGLFWYPLLRHLSKKKYCHIGLFLEKLPTIPFISPIGRTGQIITQKIKDWQNLSKNADLFIAPSNAMADALVRNGCPQSKIYVIPHGIPQQHHIIPTRPSTLRSPHIKFFYVGRICYIKGLHIMLKAFHNITNKDIELHIIGEAVSKKEKKYAYFLRRKYKKDSRIIWYGQRNKNELYSLISDFDVLIHPAICLEVFGLDIAEALQLQKFVIATKCGGAEMQIRHNNNGYLVSPNNSDELKKAIENYIVDHPKCNNDENNSITIEKHIKKLMVLYNRCLH